MSEDREPYPTYDGVPIDNEEAERRLKAFRRWLRRDSPIRKFLVHGAEAGRRDAFAAAALTGLMLGEAGRAVTHRAHHMGGDPGLRTLNLGAARILAASAVLAADALIEALAFSEPGAEAGGVDPAAGVEP